MSEEQRKTQGRGSDNCNRFVGVERKEVETSKGDTQILSEAVKKWKAYHSDLYIEDEEYLLVF